MAEQAEVLRQAVEGDLFARQGLDELALAAFGVDGGDPDEATGKIDRTVIDRGRQALAHDAHLVLDGNDHFARAGGARQDDAAADHRVGAAAHQHFVAGDPGLAFGAVEDQRLDGTPVAAKLRGARKYGAAEPGQAAITQRIDELMAVRVQPAVNGDGVETIIAAVGRQVKTLDPRPRRPGAGPLHDGLDAPGGRRMDDRVQIAIGLRQGLTALDRLADLDEDIGAPTAAIDDRQEEVARQGDAFEGQLAGRLLVVAKHQPPGEGVQRIADGQLAHVTIIGMRAGASTEPTPGRGGQ